MTLLDLLIPTPRLVEIDRVDIQAPRDRVWEKIRHGTLGSSPLIQALFAIRTLPEAYRETLLLRLVEGLPGPEIARRTGLTHGSVRVNLCRGMKLLRARLSAEEAG